MERIRSMRRARSASTVYHNEKEAPVIRLSPVLLNNDNFLVDMKLKICVLGPPRVGKTNLISRFLHDSYNQHHDGTIEEMHEYRGALSVSSSTKANEILYHTEIVDTSGRPDERKVSERSIRECDGILFVCDLTDKISIYEILLIYYTVMQIRNNAKVPIIIVGNKCDLADHSVDLSQVAKTMACPSIRASAQDGTRVALAFETLIRQIIHATYIAPFKDSEMVKKAVSSRKRRTSASFSVKLQEKVDKLLGKQKSSNI